MKSEGRWSSRGIKEFTDRMLPVRCRVARRQGDDRRLLDPLQGRVLRHGVLPRSLLVAGLARLHRLRLGRGRDSIDAVFALASNPQRLVQLSRAELEAKCTCRIITGLLK